MHLFLEPGNLLTNQESLANGWGLSDNKWKQLLTKKETIQDDKML